jgi:hypothetical protein
MKLNEKCRTASSYEDNKNGQDFEIKGLEHGIHEEFHIYGGISLNSS